MQLSNSSVCQRGLSPFSNSSNHYVGILDPEFLVEIVVDSKVPRDGDEEIHLVVVVYVCDDHSSHGVAWGGDIECDDLNWFQVLSWR